MEISRNKAKKKKKKKKKKTTPVYLLYKMKSGLASSYLSDMLPKAVGTLSRYNLRNSGDRQTIDARTTHDFKSFVPSIICDCKSVPDEAVNLESVTSFKRYLKGDCQPVQKHFYAGNRHTVRPCTRELEQCVAFWIMAFLKERRNRFPTL